MGNDAIRGDTAPEDSITIVNNASGDKVTFPILQGSCGPRVIDIRKL